MASPLFLSSSGYIYGLSDPVTHEIRYIGATRNTLVQRLCNHMVDANRDPVRTSDRAIWIRSLATRPNIFVLEEAPLEELDAIEAQYIETYLALGVRLTNSRAGGRTGWTHSETTRRKMSESSIGKNNVPYSPERLERHRETMRRPEVRQRASEAQKRRTDWSPLTEEHKQKISAAQKGRLFSEEHKNKLRESRQARRKREMSV